MEVRIKQGKEMIDATIEMVDGVMVVSPKEVKFEPKDGDVIVSGGDVRFVAIFKAMKKEYSFYYYAILVLREEKRPQLNNWASFMDTRPATEEEKKLLFDNLAKEGYSWDAERKELVNLKWKPKDGEKYFLPRCDVSGFYVRSFECEGTRVEDKYYEKGWCFKAEQECQEFCSRLNEAINKVKP